MICVIITRIRDARPLTCSFTESEPVVYCDECSTLVHKGRVAKHNLVSFGSQVGHWGHRSLQHRPSPSTLLTDLQLPQIILSSYISVPARLGKGQGAKEIEHNLARAQPKFGHNLVRKRHKIGHTFTRERPKFGLVGD